VSDLGRNGRFYETVDFVHRGSGPVLENLLLTLELGGATLTPLLVGYAYVATMAKRFEIIEMVVTASAVALAVARNDVIDFEQRVSANAAPDALNPIALQRRLPSRSPIVLPRKLAIVKSRAIVGAPAPSAFRQMLSAAIALAVDVLAQFRKHRATRVDAGRSKDAREQARHGK
jgi:hypothetical protein